MSRPLRIQYPDAWYHVMNPGRRREEIFTGKNDYNVKIAAYCLISNHYHILLQTPDANISRSMRHLNGVYTQRFNRIHYCDGQLFRGWYKLILVDADSYFQAINQILGRKNLPAVIGSKSFVDKIKEMFFVDKSHGDVPVSRSLAPDVDRIMEEVCKSYKVNKNDDSVSWIPQSDDYLYCDPDYPIEDYGS